MKEAVVNILKVFVSAAVLSAMILLLIQPVLVSGESMYPNYEDGEYLIVNKMAYKSGRIPEQGDVVVIKTNIQDLGFLIKRVIAGPGDKIEFKDGYVYVNDKQLNEEYLDDEGETYADYETSYSLKSDEVFCMGDNRLNSMDSRSKEVGKIKIKNILGKAEVRLFPFEKAGLCR